MSKIGFERFTAMNDDTTAKVEAQACGNRLMSAPWRLWEITLCRINNWGHAAFDLNELEMLVCGALGASERKAVRRGLDTLTELSRVAPGSTRLCVVVNYGLWRRGAGKGSWDDSCSEPAHRQYRRHVWSPESDWHTPKRDDSPDAIFVPPAVAGVPVWTPAQEQWTPV